MILQDVACILFAYVIGAIPTGYIIAWLHGVTRFHELGSGTSGATNVARVFGKQYFLVVLFVDAFKAYGVMYVMSSWVSGFGMMAGVGAALLVGNSYSIFVRGYGGKGIATFFGIMLAVNLYGALIFAATWLLFLILFRRAGYASVITMMLVPLAAIYYGQLVQFFIFAAVFILFRHKDHVRNFYAELGFL